ncbi:MAG: tRNA pseudouridine(38-40) synthase TruA [Myxococcales bacterium]|nr:tRNA pseudouridine(38-40) synthase TruA [Myxococcales bacterium]
MTAHDTVAVTAHGESAARRLLLWVQFDGTDFAGFQKQAAGVRTVAGELHTAWQALLAEAVDVRSSSRTDAGVHARRMPVLVCTQTHVPARGVMLGLNSMLPADLAVTDAADAEPAFDVRGDATGKRYVYRVMVGDARQPLWRRSAWHVRGPLDVAAMQAAAARLEGVHDFATFRSVACEAKSTLRHLREVRVDAVEPGVAITVDGNAFLHNMVRILAGTLVDVGRGRFAPDGIDAMLAAKERARAGQTAPAHGLTLDEVFYGPPGARQGLDYKNLISHMAASRPAARATPASSSDTGCGGADPPPTPAVP